MVALQRAYARKGSLVAEGRDLGTVVFPDAEHRFDLDADPHERARRRALQESREGWGASSEGDVLREQLDRDKRDSERALSPLTKGPGVTVLDTTEMTLEQVVAALLEKIRSDQRPGKEDAPGDR
jgi:cytidylate kinase